MDRTKFALVVLCLGLAGVVVWQQSADEATAIPPKPLQLIDKPAEPSTAAAPAVTVPAPAASAALAPGAPSASKSVNAATKKPAPRRGVQPQPLVATATPAARSESIAPSPAPVRADAPASEDADHAGTYESQALARLQQGDYRQAGELFETALRSGGKATFAIVHDHSKGNFEKDPKASCVGELVLSQGEIRFEGVGAADSHRFEASWTEVLDAGANKFFGSGMGGFHVAINPEGKYKNFNLAPRSKDKLEAKLIVDLLSSNKQPRQKGDRGK